MILGIQTGKVNKTFSDRVQEIAKARAGLIQVTRDVKGKNGKTFQRKQWVRPEDAPKGQKPKAADEEGKKRLGIRKPDEKRQKTKSFNELSPNEANYIRSTGENGKKKLFQERAEKWYGDGLLNREEAIEKLVSMGGLDHKIAEGRVNKWDRNLYSSSKENNEESATDVKTGDNVFGVDVDGKQVSGKVTSVGTHGVTIDHKHQVEHENVKKQGKAKADVESKKKGTNPKKTFIPPENFNAAEWSKQWDDPKATTDANGFNYILDSFGKEGAEIAEHIRQVEEKLVGRPMTIHKYRLSGEGESARYTEEREKLHGRIMQDLLHPDKLRAALPAPGDKPTFMILGGRGGSGKSWFKNNVYDESKYVILDADEIKSKLPEYEGWNAQDMHEESSDILEQMMTLCIKNGLNFVLDGTMKTANSALAKVYRMKSAGYRTEAHYMHLPRQEAAKRAIGRFKNGGEPGPNGEPPPPFSGRYVPVDVILKNSTNEETFNQVKGLVDNWSFRDNNVEKRGDPPTIISEGKNEVKKSYAALVKSMVNAYN